MPITWQNIRYSNPAEASRPMELATQSANNALAPLAAALGGMEKTADYNWQNEKKNYTNDARQAIMAQFTDPADLANGMKDGRIDALLGAHGNQIDKAGLLDFVDQRGDTLRQRGIQTLKYQDAMRDEATAADVDKLARSRYEKDPTKAAQMAAEATASLSEKGYRHFGDQAALADAHERELVKRTQEDRASEDQHFKVHKDVEIGFGNMRANQTSAQAAATNAETSRKEYGLHRDQAAQVTEDRITNQVATTRAEAAKYASRTAGSEEGIKQLGDFIKSNFDPVHQGLARDALNDVRDKYPNATVPELQSVLTGMSTPGMWKNGHMFYTEANVRDEAVARAGSIVGSQESKARQLANETNYQAAQKVAMAADQRLSDYRAQQAKLPGNPFGVPAPVQSEIEKAVAKGAAGQKSAPDVQPVPMATIPYTPPAAAVLGQSSAQGIMADPKVQQAQVLLQTLRTNPPKNMTMTDISLQQARAMKIIQEATDQAKAAQAAAAARAVPQLDPIKVRQWVEAGSMPR